MPGPQRATKSRSPEPIGLLIISGDEAAADPNVRAMAEQAESVLAIAMFRRLVTPLADLVLPGTSYLERDGTYVNLEGNCNGCAAPRSRKPPTSWRCSPASRSAGVNLSPYPSQVFEEVSEIVYGAGLRRGRRRGRAAEPVPPGCPSDSH